MTSPGQGKKSDDRIDRLTGCLSRGAVVSVLEAEVARCRRNGYPLACCFVDLAGIARMEDKQGRLDGNRMLAAVGVALRLRVREYDSVGRTATDQFVIVLPETRGRDCQAVAGRMRKAAREALAAMTAAQLEISVGIAEWNGAGSAAELLEAADQARGTAQRNGGGTIVRVRPRAPVDGLSALTEHLARAAGIAETAASRVSADPDHSGDRR